MKSRRRTALSLVFGLAFAAVALSAFSPSKSSAPTTPAVAASSDDTIWIRRADGGESCAPEKGQSLEDAAQDLKRHRISVFESRKGSDGKMHAQMCGAPTGTQNAYKIRRDDLAKALALGFSEAVEKKK